ncbi:Cytoplasmic dynein 2 heavy chain 1 [Rhizophlyctis rosea]|nr:Cytoplasmic dynein 2 heavy chain 1 [Rhizophlyctis rosea]
MAFESQATEFDIRSRRRPGQLPQIGKDTQWRHKRGIQTFDDEYDFWNEVAGTAEAKTDRLRADSIREILQPVKADFEKLSSTPLLDVADLADEVQGILDEIWRQVDNPPYPEPRMTHLVEAITTQFIGRVMDDFAGVNIMIVPYSKIKESLQAAVQLFDRWEATLITLTVRLWPNYSSHSWKGMKIEPAGLREFANRLKEIFQLRETHDVLTHLVPSEEQRELQIEDPLGVFANISALNCSKYTQGEWKTAVEAYKRALLPLDQRVAFKLRSIFGALQNSPAQLLREFQRYAQLVKRPTIAKQLASERETLLGQLVTEIREMQKKLSERSDEQKDKFGRNLPTSVASILWARQTISKIEETETTVESVIGTQTTYQQIASSFHEELRRYEKDQFSRWVADTQDSAEDSEGPLALERSGRLMELDYTSGKLKVNYGDQLVTLLREVRILLSLGFPVPATIQKVADGGEKFYRHGVVLKQVAHFYNTIDEQMLPSQQPMLLGPALDFERLVKDPTGDGKKGTKKSKDGVVWDNASELEAYVGKLQAAAERLTSANRRLRKLHNTVMERCVELMDVDLVKNQNKWKETIASIRGIFLTVYEGGLTESDTLMWRRHCDHQLYKALEHQYQEGLENLNEALPEITVDLVFKQQKLQFRPAYEEIRAKYYREMKKFINIPATFRGLGDGKIFEQMIDANVASLGVVYRKAELLFQNLLKVFDLFKDWVILGTVDLDEFAEEALGDVQDWEVNFRMLKSKGKEAEALPLVVKVDCITVSAAPVKATVDDHLQRLFDSMLCALRRAIAVHLAAVDEFVGKGTAALAKRPQSLSEIGEANAAHAELAGEKTKVQTHFEAVETKNRLLKSVVGAGVDTSAVRARWSKLELMLESHELMIKEQVDILRAGIDGRIRTFQADLDKFSSRWHQFKPKVEGMSDAKSASNAVTFLKERHGEFPELKKTSEQIVADAAQFGIDPPDFVEVAELENDIVQSEAIWGLYEQYVGEMEQMKKEDWISFRGKVYLFDDLATKWRERIRGREMDALSLFIQTDLDTYADVIPCLKFVRGDNWTGEHWGDLFRIIGMPRTITLSELTFGNLLDCRVNIVKHIEEIKELNNRASGEIAIREAIQEIDMWGASALFALTDYQDAKGANIKVIKDWKEVLTQVGDNQSLLSSLKESPYYKHFADKATIWEKKLVDLDEFLRDLNVVQRKWVYLEPIFSRGALPAEEHRFARIDEDFRSIIASVARDARVVSILTYPGIRETLKALVDQLERCQKALNEFLEQKRERFARFYFIGDEDLLEILGQAKNPNVIQAHLKKLFAGVHNVLFDESVTSIVAMRSIDGETVTLKAPVQITDEVEVWLENFSKEMKSTLKSLLLECLAVNDIFKYPSQILGLSEYLHFTSHVETAISQGGAFNQLSADLKGQLEKYTNFNIASVEDSVERRVVDLKIKSLILDIIHFIEVVEQLQAGKVTSVGDWAWQRQLRFYMGANDICVMRMSSAEFVYTYEYQGNPPKLVHTPLTDKCYLTLTQAMASGFGGNPFGPAGTGKTESVKALGVLFGRQVLVFNCDEGIDYKSMGRIFVGLVKCGAWGCFDEFNRLEEAVLSAVSQQIQIIQAALKQQDKQVSLLGKNVQLDPNSGIFVTLNPAGKGYGGRQKLPDNLKQLFRSVAMTHPNNELISEVILFSEGFKQGKELGSKVVSIFTLCRQLLSVQQHYEWGLRPLKAVLGLAGHLLHAERRAGPVDPKREAAIMVKAIRANTLSKLTFADSQRFNGLMQDIFPDVPVEDIQYEELKKAVRETYDEMNLVYIESQVGKIFQFYEACKQRMGVVIVGPSGCGKSVLWRILRTALQKTGQKLPYHLVNPKAIERRRLLGHMDIDTREWYDGVITSASRQAVKEPTDVHSWIVCDGDIDPEWVESLNSVLDDNRLLTMPNGERIQFGPNVNFIFETHNLKFASPATVSRMGMIYLSDETLDVPALVRAWVAKQPEKLRSALSSWLDEFFYKSVDWILRNCETVVETAKVGLLMNGLSHLMGVSDRTQFLYALIRGLGANLYMENRVSFANELLRWANEPAPDPKGVLNFYVNSSGRVAPYQSEEPGGLDMGAMQDLERLPVIETIDVKRALDMIMPWFTHNQPFLLIGPEGAGKHMILRHCFSKLKSISTATIHCSAQTRSSHILQRLQQTCSAVQSTTGRVLRPRDAERLVLYLKDINLPKPDKYDTVELVQFLQQILTYNGFYDQNLEWVSIENVQIVASMNPSSTMGRHKLSTRFTSVIRQCFISYPEREQLQAVYRLLAQPILSSCLPSHKIWSMPKNVQKLANTMVAIFDQTVLKFTVDQHPHYFFTPRDLSRWVIDLSRYQYSDAEMGELLDVLTYEAQRLFQDRLVGQDSRKRFLAIVTSQLQADWGHQSNLADTLFTSVSTSQSSAHLTAARGLIKVSVKTYSKAVQQAIKIYERDYQDLHMCLFPEALEQIARMERVLGQPSGSLLLAGRPGVGRRSSVLIVTHMLGMKLFTPMVGRQYSKKAFTADIKSVLQSAGVAQEEVVLMLESYQLIDPSFLESINSLLSGGEVPGLYSQDELDAVLNSLKDEHSQDGFRGSLFEYFISRIRKHLHVVLLFDCTSPTFVASCEANPALYIRCQMEWMDAWAPESMNELAASVFSKNQILAELKEQDKLIRAMIAVHGICAQRGATPKHFVEYTATYERVYCSKRENFHNKQKYLASGLKKLNEAAKYVDKLSAEAKTQEVELSQKQKEADSALKQITDSMVNAAEQKKEMETLNTQLAEEEKKLIKRKAAIEKELADVEPLIKKSQEAVGEIRPESLTEIRSLRAPPPAVRDVLEGVLRLMGILDMSWNSMKGFLGKRTIKEEIMNFNARNITPQVRASVADLLKQKRDSFDEAAIKRASVAAAPLAMWVKANLQYSEVLEKIGPLESDLEKLTKSLDSSRERVVQLKEALAAVDKTVAGLKEGFGSKTREAELLRNHLDQAKTTIKAAQELLHKLSGEGKRWNSQYKEIHEELALLPRNALLSAAFITYLAGESEDVRQRLVAEWKKITGIEQFDVRTVLSTESEQLVWKSQGLPSDALSIENATVTLNGQMTPLLVDPSGQAIAWLKTYLSDRKPEIINQHDETFLRALELAVRFGKTLIVQDTFAIEPVLYPLLRKDLQKQGPRYVVQIGDKSVDYNESFRLYLVTRRSEFISPPDAEALVNEVNFTVTRAGLAGQLLGVTLKHERPELEVEKVNLLKKEDELRLELSKVEDALLQELASSEGNILENKGLINSLNETKTKSVTISTGLAESRKLQASLDTERDKFSALSSFGSSLFFVITDLKKLNNMYQFSLASYLRIFSESLKAEGSDSKDSTELRMKLLMSTLERLTYRYISRSLFKADRQTFALYMVHELHPQLFEPKEWELFIGQLVVSDVDEKGSPPPAWIPPERMSAFKTLQATLPALCQSSNLGDTENWTRWIRSRDANNNIPNSKLSAFQRLIFMQAFRPDQLMTAMNNFTCSVLGVDNLAPPPLSLKRVQTEESVPSQPILFITTPGTDPSQELKDFASQEVGLENYHQIAMGQGQGEIAIEVLRECAANGGWLCLQNIHLVIGWLPTLEKELATAKFHDSFRLWLTSESHSKFPANLLQNCLKITVEAPPGLKKNLQRTYEAWSPQFIASGPVHRAQALFALAWFHAVVQERRTYIPQGWTKFYEFSAADLRSSADLVSTMCAGAKPPQWEVLHGLLENAIYGGRIDDVTDALKLRTYLLQMFNDDVLTVGGRAPTRKLVKGITLPSLAEHSSFAKIINELPEIDNISMFGLPANIDRTLQTNGSQAVISQLRILRQVDAQGQRFDKEKWSKELMPFLQLWKKLNSGNDLLQRKVTQSTDKEPVTTFLTLELTNALELIRRIHSDLSNVSKVIRGTMLVTNDILDIATSLMKGETPETWLSLWEGPEEPQTYLRECVTKGLAVDTLKEKANRGTIFDASVQLANLYNPVTFLNALRQQTSRKVRQPMDSLKLVSTWSAQELSSAALKVSVEGLFLQGCNFDGARLSEAGPDDPVSVTVPTCHLAWLPMTFTLPNRITLPLYQTPTRERVVASLMVPCQDDGSTWVLAGAAFFLSP